MDKAIEPGLGISVDIIVDVDDIKETIDVRKAIVYEVARQKITLSQTTPPLSDRRAGEEVLVTYLAEGDKGPVRLGFSGKLIEPDGKYELVPGTLVRAVILSRISGSKKKNPFNLRMHHRINPGCSNGIEMWIGKEPVNIIDISIGGARVGYRYVRSLDTERHVDITLRVEEETFKLMAKVIRGRSSAVQKRESMKYASLQFVGVNDRLNFVLGGKIFAIERKRRSRGLA